MLVGTEPGEVPGILDELDLVLDQVLVVTGLAQLLVDHRAVHEDLLAVAFGGLEGEALEALLHDRQQAARADVLRGLVGAERQRCQAIDAVVGF